MFLCSLFVHAKQSRARDCGEAKNTRPRVSQEFPLLVPFSQVNTKLIEHFTAITSLDTLVTLLSSTTIPGFPGKFGQLAAILPPLLLPLTWHLVLIESAEEDPNVLYNSGRPQSTLTLFLKAKTISSPTYNTLRFFLIIYTNLPARTTTLSSTNEVAVAQVQPPSPTNRAPTVARSQTQLWKHYILGKVRCGIIIEALVDSKRPDITKVFAFPIFIIVTSK